MATTNKRIVTYEEAVKAGKIFVWSSGGDKLAKSERFDANNKFLMDNMNALNNDVDNAMKYNRALQEELNAEVRRHLEELDKIKKGAHGTLDTLVEISAALGNDKDFAANITKQLSNRFTKEEIKDILVEFVRRDGDQSITGDLIPDKAFKRALGSPNLPFKELFVNALVIDNDEIITTDAGRVVVSGGSEKTLELTANGKANVIIGPNGTGKTIVKTDLVLKANAKIGKVDGSTLEINNPIQVRGNVNADKFNGFTIKSNVPENARFTDRQLTKEQIVAMKFVTTDAISMIEKKMASKDKDITQNFDSMSLSLSKVADDLSNVARASAEQDEALSKSLMSIVVSVESIEKKFNKMSNSINDLKKKVDSVFDRVDLGGLA